MSDDPTPSAAGTGAIYGHSAEGIKAAQEDVVIPGAIEDDKTSDAGTDATVPDATDADATDADATVKHEDGLA